MEWDACVHVGNMSVKPGEVPTVSCWFYSVKPVPTVSKFYSCCS